MKFFLVISAGVFFIRQFSATEQTANTLNMIAFMASLLLLINSL